MRIKLLTVLRDIFVFILFTGRKTVFRRIICWHLFDFALPTIDNKITKYLLQVHISKAFPFKCPEQAQWSLRVGVHCPDTSKYFCLNNYLISGYSENCTAFDFQRPGNSNNHVKKNAIFNLYYISTYQLFNCSHTSHQYVNIFTIIHRIFQSKYSGFFYYQLSWGTFPFL